MPAAGPLSPHGPQRPTAAPKRPAPASHAVPDQSEVAATSKEATLAGLVALPRPRSEPSKERRDRLSPPRRICHPALLILLFLCLMLTLLLLSVKKEKTGLFIKQYKLIIQGNY
jgi:hypothetical protein